MIPVGTEVMTAVEGFEEAARILHLTKYCYGPEDRKQMLLEIGPLLREVCYQLDRLDAVPADALEAFRAAAGLDRGVLKHFRTSAELVLTSAVQQTVDSIDGQGADAG